MQDCHYSNKFHKLIFQGETVSGHVLFCLQRLLFWWRSKMCAFSCSKHGRLQSLLDIFFLKLTYLKEQNGWHSRVFVCFTFWLKETTKHVLFYYTNNARKQCADFTAKMYQNLKIALFPFERDYCTIHKYKRKSSCLKRGFVTLLSIVHSTEAFSNRILKVMLVWCSVFSAFLRLIVLQNWKELL